MIDFLYPYFLCILDCVVLYIGFYVCFKEERNKNILLLILSVLVFAYLDHLITDVWVMNEWICEITVTIVLFIFIFISYPKNIINKIVYYLILDCVSFFIIISIGIILNLINVEFTTNHLIISTAVHSTKFIFYIITGKLLRKSFRSLDNKSIKVIFKTLLIPSLIMTMLFELYFVIENQLWFNLILILYVISFIALIATTIRLVKMIQNETKNVYIEKMLMQTHTQMKKIDAYHKEVRKIKHDFKNHLIIIEDLLKQNKQDKLQKYLSDLEVLVSKVETPEISGNIYLDAILNHKKEEHKNINFVYQVSCSNELFINEIDLCSLVFNLIDNAIEELQRNKKLEKRIEFTFREVNNEIFIKVVNPLTNNKNLISEKNDHANHGLGIDIIRNIVNKYDGEILITQNENFIVEIMLNKK